MAATRPTVIFDGDCGICSRTMAWLGRVDRAKIFEPLPLQSPELPSRFPSISREACEEAMHVVLADGRIFAGADAFREIFLRIPLTWTVGVFMAIPPIPWIARRAYRRFARNRHRFGSVCSINRRSGE